MCISWRWDNVCRTSPVEVSWRTRGTTWGVIVPLVDITRGSVWKSEKSAVDLCGSCILVGMDAWLSPEESVWFRIWILVCLGTFFRLRARFVQLRSAIDSPFRNALLKFTDSTLKTRLCAKLPASKKGMFCRNQTTRATVARGSALEMEIRRGKFRKSVFLDTSQVGRPPWLSVRRLSAESQHSLLSPRGTRCLLRSLKSNLQTN